MEKKIAIKLKRYTRFLVYTTTAALTVTGVCYYMGNKNYQDYKKETPNDFVDPTSRSGSLLFMKHSCGNSFSVNDITRCYIHKFYSYYVSRESKKSSFRQGNFDNIGVLLQKPDNYTVMYTYYGKFYEVPYQDFMALPFFSEIWIRNIETTHPSLDSESLKFKNDVEDLINIIENGWPSQKSKIFRDSVDLVLNY